MAGNQDGFLSDIDLSALAQGWAMLNPEARLQQEMGQDAPNVRGGLGALEDAATGPVAGVQGLRSLLKLLLQGKGAKEGVRHLVETPGYKDAMLREVKRQRARAALDTRPRIVSDATSARIPRRTVTPQAPPTSGRSVRARLLRGRKR